MGLEIKPLTGLRGIAALWVALYHIHWVAVSQGVAPVALRHGYLAVDIFFVLSGYVMTMTYADRAAHWSPARYLDFLVRRLGRVWPLYALVTVALAAAMALRLLQNSPPGPASILVNLSLTQSWWGVHSIDEPSWSVSAEMLAYLVFPPLALLLSNRRPIAYLGVIALMIAGIAGLPTLQVWQAGHRFGGNGPLDISDPTTVAPLLRCFLGFTIGIATYRLGQIGWLRHAADDRTAGLVLIATLALIALPGTDLAIVAIAPALVLVMAAQGRVAEALFANPVVHALGRWSYALYLIHFHSNMIQGKISAHLPWTGSMARPIGHLGQYALLILVSALLYAWVEKPAQRQFRKLSRVIERDQGTAPLLPETAEGVV